MLLMNDKKTSVKPINRTKFITYLGTFYFKIMWEANKGKRNHERVITFGSAFSVWPEIRHMKKINYYTSTNLTHRVALP